MPNYFGSLIQSFAQETAASSWDLNRFDVALKLLRVLDGPDLLNQDAFGFCGEISFLRAWLLRAPETVVQFARQLYNTGRSQIGSYQVAACDGLLHSTYIENNPSAAITSAPWMICGALADTEDNFLADFGGEPDGGLSVATITSELKSWLEATGLYRSVDTHTYEFIKGFGTPDADDALQLRPGPATDVFLMINANMFLNLVSSGPQNIADRTRASGFPENLVANHWIMLEKPIEDLGNGQVRMSIWTWGSCWELVLAKEDFNNDYYGSVIANAYGTRRTIAPMPLSAADAFARTGIWYSQGKTMELSWSGYAPNTEWLNVMEPGNADPVRFFWPDGGIHLHSLSMSIPDPADPHSHYYRLDACNTTGASASSPGVQPMCRTETEHFRISYFGYKSLEQIRDAESHKGVEVRSASGRLLGRGYPDGRMEIEAGGTIRIDRDVNTPDYIARLAIALECSYHGLTDALGLPDPGGYGKTEVLVRKGGAGASVGADGGATIRIDPQMNDADIPVTVLNRLYDLVERRWAAAPQLGTPQAAAYWDTPSRALVQDALLDAGKFVPLLQAGMQHLGDGFGSSRAAAVLWAYACAQTAAGNASGADPLGPTIAGCWRNVWGAALDADKLRAGLLGAFYASDDDTRYGDLALAAAGPLLAKVPADARFQFGPYQATLARPSATTATLGAGAVLPISGTLANPYSVAYHVVSLDAAVANAGVAFQAGAGALFQVALLDAGDTILDVIRTASVSYTRTIGLRGGTVKKLLFTVAGLDKPVQYTLRASAVETAADIMITRWNRDAGRELAGDYRQKPWDWDTPDLWLTSEDDTPRDEINVLDDNVKSIVHVRLRNFGNQAAQQVRVKLFYKPGSGLAQQTGWQPLLPDGLPAGQNWVALDVPANGSAEAAAKWFCPLRDKKTIDHQQAVSFFAQVEYAGDASADNNCAYKNHAWTNAKVAKTPHFSVDWPVYERPGRPWEVAIHMDGEDILNGPALVSRTVRVIAAARQPKTGTQAASLDIQVDSTRLNAIRQAPAAAWRKAARIPVRWKTPRTGNQTRLPVTVSLQSEGRIMGGFTVGVPVPAAAPVIPRRPQVPEHILLPH